MKYTTINGIYEGTVEEIVQIAKLGLQPRDFQPELQTVKRSHHGGVLGNHGQPKFLSDDERRQIVERFWSTQNRPTELLQFIHSFDYAKGVLSTGSDYYYIWHRTLGSDRKEQTRVEQSQSKLDIDSPGVKRFLEIIGLALSKDQTYTKSCTQFSNETGFPLNSSQIHAHRDVLLHAGYIEKDREQGRNRYTLSERGRKAYDDISLEHSKRGYQQNV